METLVDTAASLPSTATPEAWFERLLKVTHQLLSVLPADFMKTMTLSKGMTLLRTASAANQPL